METKSFLLSTVGQVSSFLFHTEDDSALDTTLSVKFVDVEIVDVIFCGNGKVLNQDNAASLLQQTQKLREENLDFRQKLLDIKNQMASKEKQIQTQHHEAVEVQKMVELMKGKLKTCQNDNLR